MDKDTQTNEPFFVQMVSDNYMEHCDLYPHQSIQKVLKDGDRLKLANRTDWMPTTFKTKAIETLPELKQCVSCKNDFPIDADFINVGKEPHCVRCYERLYLPDRIQYEAIKKKQLLAQIESSKWISVNDRLPTVGSLYNVIQDLKDGDLPLAWSFMFDAQTKKWLIDDSETEEFGITHWQELPPPIN